MKISSAEFVSSGVKPPHYPVSDLPEVAFAGRSNVGKSSLLNNMMLRRNLVKVSSKPGHTRLLNWFRVNDRVLFCDLPGYGFARVSRDERASWGRMIGTYLQERGNLLALVILVDVRRGFEEDDLSLMSTCAELQLQPILVATKCDKLTRNELMRRKKGIGAELGIDPDRDVIWYSAETGQGREQLWRRINGLLPQQSDEV